MTIKERALQAVLNCRDEHGVVWRGAPESRWLAGLVEEVGELAAALGDRHEHYPDWELIQISAICLNWLEYRMQLGIGRPEPALTLREALEAIVGSIRDGAGVCGGHALNQGEEAPKRCS